MDIHSAAARSYSNIAFIKYWGNRDAKLRIPVNGSISMNLKGIETTTMVSVDTALAADTLTLNGNEASGAQLERVSAVLDHIRGLAGTDARMAVTSENNFPMGTGIASSAAAFSALAVAACAALGLNLSERQLSTVARLGSGSASRSIPGGFVEWYAGDDHDSSYAESIAPPEHWDLVDLVAVVSKTHKATGSTGGHVLAPTSPLHDARVDDAPRRLEVCREAIMQRDFETFAQVVEQDALMMHAVMLTSQPALLYWDPPTLSLIDAVYRWRTEGLPVCFTFDAGPNAHVLTTSTYRGEILNRLRAIEGVITVLQASAGGPAHLLPEE